jgi:hypothetical protein
MSFSLGPSGRLARGEIDFAPVYADDYRGWPLAPRAKAHGVYGTFGNPTTIWPSGTPGPNVGYHKAIDLPVNDATGPKPVFAVEGGVVREAKHAAQVTPLAVRVRAGVVGIAHFRYAHVVPSVEVGERVEPGQEVGRTAPGWWHVHLEEWATEGGARVALNPLRPGGKLAPARDPGKPFVSALRIYARADEANPAPRALRPDRVRGVVVPAALAMDAYPLADWPGAPVVPLHVYRARVRLAHGGQVVHERTLFQLDSAPGPTWRHFFRPLTRRSAPVAVCVVRKPRDCAGRFWIRLSERGWDTRRVPNGWYELTLTVEDAVGRRAERTLRFRVAN